ncbi:putative ABC transporter permease [Paratractidigestivibacter sp.]|uniref:putative ABC transporter permease n=1 Tax=Paratractidigestivibacter sp. TaxID=2847316 RepID=UPI003AB3EAC2
MIVSQYVVWFVLFGLFGWVFESAYCSITEKRWCNRGFLFGPICPIYGTGAVAAIAVFGSPAVEALAPSPVAVFFICAAGASAIEWATSIVLEHAFGTVWWDYSNLPLNLSGRICVPAAALFGAAGLGVVYIAIPLVGIVSEAVPPIAFETCALVATAMLAADTTLTVCTLTEVLAAIERAEAELNQRVQATLDEVQATFGDAHAAVVEGADRLIETGSGHAERLREGGAERLGAIAGHLNARQQHVLYNARRFTNKGRGIAARRLTDALDALLRRKGDAR